MLSHKCYSISMHSEIALAMYTTETYEKNYAGNSNETS